MYLSLTIYYLGSYYEKNIKIIVTYTFCEQSLNKIFKIISKNEKFFGVFIKI